MTNSQIQQSSPNAARSQHVSQADVAGIEAFIARLQQSLPDLGLSPENEADIRAEIQTVEAQAKSSKPKSTVISECLRSIRSILEGAAGSMLATELLAAISKLVQ